MVRRTAVSASAKPPDSEKALTGMFEARARAELAAADAMNPGSDAVPWRGALLARVALVKGLPGPAEAAGGAALSGSDGAALEKALERLGWEPADAFFTLSRSAPGFDADRCSRRLRAQIEAVDPLVVVALGPEASADLASAFSGEPLAAGSSAYVLGRRMVATDDFEASLTTEGGKRKVWRQLRAAAPPGPVY